MYRDTPSAQYKSALYNEKYVTVPSPQYKIIFSLYTVRTAHCTLGDTATQLKFPKPRKKQYSSDRTQGSLVDKRITPWVLKTIETLPFHTASIGPSLNTGFVALLVLTRYQCTHLCNMTPAFPSNYCIVALLTGCAAGYQ